MSTNWEEQGWVKIGEVGVDSASVWIGDPAYAPDTTKIKESVMLPLQEAGHGELNEGVWSFTLEGDGTYPVYAQMHEWKSSNGRTYRRPRQLLIDFDIYDDDEDDEDEESPIPLRPKQNHITTYVGKSYGDE